MDINKAYEILNQATASVVANRMTHVEIQKALNVVREFIESHSVAKSEEK